MQAGKIVALVSDAGTPPISDPGNRIVKGAIAGGIQVVALPGATAFVPALSSAVGWNQANLFLWVFRRIRDKTSHIAKDHGLTTIFYESPHRVMHLVEKLWKFGEQAPRSVARKLLLYEEFLRGSAGEIAQRMKNETSLRGENCSHCRQRLWGQVYVYYIRRYRRQRGKTTQINLLSARLP